LSLIIIFRADDGMPTARPVIRRGQCDTTEVAAQAGVAEVAVDCGVVCPPPGNLTYDPDSAVFVATEPAPASPGQIAASARQDRNTRLSACDWTQLADAPVTEATRAAFAAYRQALRDISDTPNWPEAPQWPAKPYQETTS
jgi:hypothetical protein